MAILRRFAAKIRRKFYDNTTVFMTVAHIVLLFVMILSMVLILLFKENERHPEQKVETTAEVVSVGSVLENYDARGIMVRFEDVCGCQREVGVLVDKSTDFKAGDFFVFCYNLTTADFINSAVIFEISENNGSYNMEKR